MHTVGGLGGGGAVSSLTNKPDELVFNLRLLTNRGASGTAVYSTSTPSHRDTLLKSTAEELEQI